MKDHIENTLSYKLEEDRRIKDLKESNVIWAVLAIMGWTAFGATLIIETIR